VTVPTGRLDAVDAPEPSSAFSRKGLFIYLPKKLNSRFQNSPMPSGTLRLLFPFALALEITLIKPYMRIDVPSAAAQLGLPAIESSWFPAEPWNAHIRLVRLISSQFYIEVGLGLTGAVCRFRGVRCRRRDAAISTE